MESANLKENNNKRVLVIFTSKFNLSNVSKDDLNQAIMNLHLLQINVIIFGYELDFKDSEFQSPTNINEPINFKRKVKHESRSYDEKQV